jgi:hypothetical protein
MIKKEKNNNWSWESTQNGEIYMTPKFKTMCVLLSKMFPNNLKKGIPLSDNQIEQLESELELCGFHTTGVNIGPLIVNPFINGKGCLRWEGETIQSELEWYNTKLKRRIK